MTNELAKKWDTEHTRIPKDKTQSPYAEQREAEFPRNSLLADLGSGTGADAIYFLQHGHKVIAIDISSFALEQAAQKATDLGLDLDTREAVIGTDPIPLDDDSVDGVYSRLALHYFDRQTTIEVMKQIYSKLKVGGTAFLTLKSPEDKQEMEFLKQSAKEIEAGVFNDEGQIKSRFTVDQLKEILKESGIESSEVTSYVEDLSGRTDLTKSGNVQLLLNEIRFTKV